MPRSKQIVFRARERKPQRLDPSHKKVGHRESEEIFNFIDKMFQAQLARVTASISPASISTAYFSWIAQLLQSPGRLLGLKFYLLTHLSTFINNLKDKQPGQGKDIRFQSESWQYMPWRLWAEEFLFCEEWWQYATINIPGVSSQTERIISFSVRQILDALSPANFILTNPDLFAETIRSQGVNLVRGTELALKHFIRKQKGEPPPGAECFIPGKQVAITKGKVVYRNHLIEVIQYTPQTKQVYKEPILIIPAWIMKYYILDLSPENSLVNWLVKRGHTVFIVSWRNPTKEDRDISMDDYYRLGAISAINTVEKLIPRTKIHLMGYCLGGTLAIITAASLALKKDKRLQTLTLLAAQADFTEAGELMLFISESEISFLENMMWDQGYLDTKQMAGSFQMLRSYDLIWSKMIQDYMHGTERGMIDLLAWNADATRMPYKMHSEYLEKLFLNNDLASGRFTVEDEHIVAENIKLPIFAVSTEKDHVAPWQSVYKVHLLINSDITFVLANGGHNAGIVSEPGHKNRYYRILKHAKEEIYLSPKSWLKKSQRKEGSWWPAWQEWLVQLSSPKKVPARKIKSSLMNAPGSYIHQK